MQIVYVFFGGGLGALCRYGISSLIHPSSKGFPFHTIAANFFSSLILGLLLSFFLIKGDNVNIKLFWVVGFCGGFSTFSSFSSETHQLLEAGYYGLALLNIIVSIVICILAISGGLFIGTQCLK